MPNAELAFEHQVIRPLKALKSRPARLLVAVSGGVDSLVLAEVLRRWRRHLRWELTIAHVHHGLGADAKQNRFRNRAQKLVREWALGQNLPFVTNTPEKLELRSESELRDYRMRWLQQWCDQDGAIAFAHHRDDLLETRLLRLIRGTGESGLKAMRLKSGKKIRPLLACSRAQIENYARARGLKWADDPTNSTSDSLRNWLRHEWIPALERRQAGASRSLARSLENLARSQFVNKTAMSTLVGLRREEMSKASFAERELLVANYLRGLGVKNYGQSHVREILKRIDTRQKNLTFTMLGVVFRVTQDFLWASRV